MQKISFLKKSVSCAAILIASTVFSQEIIYQQNFDGNNGNYTNTLLSSTTPTNGWLTSSTAAQYGNYRHIWNFSNVTTGGNQNVMPISGRSLGIGFFNGNTPNVPNQFFRTWDGDEPETESFFTTRWAHVGVSTLGYENITVEFKWRCLGEEDSGKIYDYGSVNTSINGGATWLMDETGGQGGETSEHGSFGGGLYYGNSEVKTAVLTMPANRANQENFRIAFRMVADEGYGTGGGFIIDDIIVRGTKIPTAATAEVTKNKLKTYKDGESFVIRSTSANIVEVEIYDASGKLTVSSKEKNTDIVRINTNSFAKGIYIIKAKLDSGEELTQKIRN